MIEYNQREIKRLKQDILKKLIEDIKQDMERDGVKFIEDFNAQEVFYTDTQSVGSIEIYKQIAEELRDQTVTRYVGNLAKTYKRDKFR